MSLQFIDSSPRVARSARILWPVQHHNSRTYCWLGSLLLLTLTTFHPAALADSSASDVFYHQLIKQSSFDRAETNHSLIGQVAPHLNTFNLPLNDSKQADDLAFNYLWMQQHQQGYRGKNGGAAAGRLIRMSLRSLYKNHYGSSNVTNASSEDDFADNFSNIDYRLRVSGDKLNLGVKYTF